MACTTFFLERGTEKVYARTLDWSTDHGALVVNKRNVQKKSMFLDQNQRALEWVSEFGSLSFDQVSREFPYGGINERGLVIETLIFKDSDYASGSLSTASVNESQWIQYMLDRAQSLSDVENLSRDLPVIKMFAPLHYFVCDSEGDCGVFEFLNGKIQVRRGETLPIAALANSSYPDSLNFIRNLLDFGGTNPMPTDNSSLARFSRAAAFVKNYRGTDLVDDSFSQLNNISGSGTKWKVVYDLRARNVYFKTASAKTKKWVNVGSGLDYSCRTPVKVLDLQASGSGDVSRSLTDYTSSFNQRLIQKSKFLPAELRQALGNFPETQTRCLD